MTGRIFIVAALTVAAVIVVAGLLYFFLAGSITVSNAFYTDTPRAIGVFGTIYNGKPCQVCLVEAELAEPGMVMVEIHETIFGEGGVHQMRPVEKLCIPPRATLELKPGG